MRGRICRCSHRGMPVGVDAPAAGGAYRHEPRPPVLKVDNQPAIALAKNPVLHDRSKHIDVKFHFLRDCVEEKQIVIEFVETGRQLADIFTKPVGRLRFLELRSKIGMVEVKSTQQD